MVTQTQEIDRSSNSCTNGMTIFGVVYLKRCLIVLSYNLEKTIVIVTENIINSDEDTSDKASRQIVDEITVIKEKSVENEDVAELTSISKNIDLEIKNSSDEGQSVTSVDESSNAESESDLNNLEVNDMVAKPIEYEDIDRNKFIEAET
ncbi:unnamed protein product [Brachionus calyciflorus]|uniref:Uncharacterized protein n=1 Tax=Brachionus calyciflorus TaxID=104777 RepID=A0A814L2W1_9BILA|nr:unnamed protein product [Brachionus calyciflorus]